MSFKKISSDNNPLPPNQVFNLTPKEGPSIKGVLYRAIHHPRSREITQKVLAVLGGLILATGIACGIALGCVGTGGIALPLLIATAVGVVLGASIVSASVALKLQGNESIALKKIKSQFTSKSRPTIMSEELGNVLGKHFKSQSSLPKSFRVPESEEIKFFKSKENSNVTLSTFKLPRFFNPIVHNGKGVSRLCFIPPECDSTDPFDNSNSSADAYRLALGAKGWERGIEGILQRPREPGSLVCEKWESITSIPGTDDPELLVNIFNPFGFYPKTPTEKPGDLPHPLYGNKSLEAQTEMFKQLFSSLIENGIEDIAIYSSDITFPRDKKNDCYVNTFAPLDAKFENRVLVALSQALHEVAKDKKQSRFNVCLFGISKNPIYSLKSLNQNMYQISNDFDDYLTDEDEVYDYDYDYDTRYYDT